MKDHSSQRREELGYRRGVLLGLTIAEIILLLLFALLLALWGQISLLSDESNKAKAIINKFSDVIKRADAKSDKELQIEVEKIIQLEIDYAARFAKEIELYKDKILPDDVFELIKSMKFDLNKFEDREKLRNLLKLMLQYTLTTNESLSVLTEQCNVGGIVSKKLNGLDPNRIFSDLEHWKSVAASCGKSNLKPSCYQYLGKDVFIFEARLNDNGILLKNTVPDQLLDTFNQDFPVLPPFNITINQNDFKLYMSPFIKYSNEKNCLFRVNAFDDTGIDKKYFQKIEKSLDSVFWKRKNW